MKRTINEIYELIKQKKESAKNNRDRIYRNNYQHIKGIKVHYISNKEYELKGEIDAYTDVLCLIESSGVLDDK